MCQWHEVVDFDLEDCELGERHGECVEVMLVTAGCAGPPCEVDGARPHYNDEQDQILLFDGICGQIPVAWNECHAGPDELEVCSCYCE